MAHVGRGSGIVSLWSILAFALHIAEIEVTVSALDCKPGPLNLMCSPLTFTAAEQTCANKSAKLLNEREYITLSRMSGFEGFSNTSTTVSLWARVTSHKKQWSQDQHTGFHIGSMCRAITFVGKNVTNQYGKQPCINLSKFVCKILPHPTTSLTMQATIVATSQSTTLTPTTSLPTTSTPPPTKQLTTVTSSTTSTSLPTTSKQTTTTPLTTTVLSTTITSSSKTSIATTPTSSTTTSISSTTTSVTTITLLTETMSSSVSRSPATTASSSTATSPTTITSSSISTSPVTTTSSSTTTSPATTTSSTTNTYPTSATSLSSSTSLTTTTSSTTAASTTTTTLSTKTKSRASASSPNTASSNTTTSLTQTNTFTSPTATTSLNTTASPTTSTSLDKKTSLIQLTRFCNINTTNITCYRHCSTRVFRKASQIVGKISNYEIPKNVTSAFRRQKTSAYDERQSSGAFGYISILFMSLVLGVIVSMDISKVLHKCSEKAKRKNEGMNAETFV